MPFFDPDDVVRWTGGRWTAPARPARRVVHDSKAVTAGDLFVAIRGARFDGHAFAAEALARGAAGAVVEADRANAGAAGPLLVVRDTRRALLDLARGHRARIRGEIIAVTGSVGKSTVKEMIASILAQAGAVARNPGNWNNDLGVPLSLLAMEPDTPLGIFEIGMNHPGEIAPLCDLLRPRWGVMTRIGPVHLEFFADEAAIANEKALLFRALPPDGTAVAAADEPWWASMQGAAPCRVVSVALDGPADFRGRLREGSSATLEVTEPDGACHAYPLALAAGHLARNALRAVAVGRLRGLAAEAVAAGLSAFRPPPMRWEELEYGGLRWINDAYNSSPLSMQAALDTFARMAVEGGRWLVLGGMREMGASSREAHRALGREIAGGPWTGLIAKGELAADIAEGAREAGWNAGRAVRCADAVSAAAAVDERVREGDAVLLKGSRGEQMEEVLTEWGRRHDLPPPAGAHG